MKILLVEDDAQIASQISDQLKRANFVVELSRDGQDAWFRAETEIFDALIIDLGLPKLDGLSVIRRLRKAGVLTPIVVLTARGAWIERVEGIDAGADDYLPKPFHMEELLSRLNAVLRRSAGHGAPTIEAGPIAIDTRRMIVTLNGARVDLPPREFLLIRYLMHNKNTVVSQAQIEDHIYGDEQEPGSNAVEALVKRVRQKLGADTVQTRRGFGYVVEG